MIRNLLNKLLPREAVLFLIDVKRRLFKGSESKVLYAKWRENEVVQKWIKNGWIKDRDFRILSFEWEKFGRPVPPPHQVKEAMVADFGQSKSISTLIETGTYLGDMIMKQKDNFSKIISVELSKELWKKAVMRFKDFNHIEIVNGDSSVELKNVLRRIEDPVVFWLDGHYSGGITAKGESNCPIYGELDAIFETNRKDHVILIDDARLFNGQNDYPTMQQIEGYVRKHWPECGIETHSDIIQIQN